MKRTFGDKLAASLLALDALDRRKPHERRRSYCIGSQDLGGFERE
jgi:hypothetical protein